MRLPVVLAVVVLLQLFLGAAIAGYALVDDARRPSARATQVASSSAHGTEPPAADDRRGASVGCHKMVRQQLPRRSSLAFLREHVQVDVKGRTYVVGGTVRLDRPAATGHERVSRSYVCTMTLPSSGSWDGSVQVG